ncbi:MAG: manganese efflux pump [SAR324 cluster bacterium]|nr:manganese efflux pump [SAR324 cluster bacterium]
MSYFEIVLLGFALAADSFTVGATVGLKHRRPRQIFRLSFHFGLFQGLFPLLGALAGTFLLSFMEAWDHWIVFVILTFLGIRMIIGAFKDESDQHAKIDLTKGSSLIGLSTAVSIDALAAGISLSIADAPIAISVTIIGLVSVLATAFAMIAAKFAARWVGKKGEAVAGIVLIGLGLKTLNDHMGILEAIAP